MKQIKPIIEANSDSDFSIHNFPFGVHKKHGIVSVLGNQVILLRALVNSGYFFNVETNRYLCQWNLNDLMAAQEPVAESLRKRLFELFSGTDPVLKNDREQLEKCLLDYKPEDMLLPVKIGDYTDFYASKEHAENVGTLFRGKENALNPNWKHLPVAYHGRSSSIQVGHQSIQRPKGQVLNAEGKSELSAAKAMDFELEMAFFVGRGNALGQSIEIGSADDAIFGYSLFNDWSARDIQRWEYVPLGPFLGKNFASSVSPWVVLRSALEPFRCPPPPQDPQPLPYLSRVKTRTYDIQLEVWLKPAESGEAVRISSSNFRYLYWTPAQMIAHHTVNGCNLRTGDCLATGTISGPAEKECGSLLELTKGGKQPIDLGNGIQRSYLEDGDEITLKGWCQGKGYRIGFGNLVTQIAY